MECRIASSIIAVCTVVNGAMNIVRYVESYESVCAWITGEVEEWCWYGGWGRTGRVLIVFFIFTLVWISLMYISVFIAVISCCVFIASRYCNFNYDCV